MLSAGRCRFLPYGHRHTRNGHIGSSRAPWKGKAPGEEGRVRFALRLEHSERITQNEGTSYSQMSENVSSRLTMPQRGVILPIYGNGKWLNCGIPGSTPERRELPECSAPIAPTASLLRGKSSAGRASARRVFRGESSARRVFCRRLFCALTSVLTHTDVSLRLRRERPVKTSPGYILTDKQSKVSRGLS